MGKRVFDLTISTLLIALLGIPMLLLAGWIRMSSDGPALYWSERVGRNGTRFMMPKFRTMRKDTPELATHLLGDADGYLTPGGAFLRKYSLDELPQLFSIFRGEMSFVGPRPALFNQTDLIQLRSETGTDALTPGLTGWAQINGRDELPIPQKVACDHYYLQHRGLWLDAKILLVTIVRVFNTSGVHH